jgi:hypothetical protein
MQISREAMLVRLATPTVVRPSLQATECGIQFLSWNWVRHNMGAAAAFFLGFFVTGGILSV